MKTKNKFKVEIVEFERGWGQRTDSIETFPTERKARNFVERYNSKNTLNEVPDIYTKAFLRE